MNHRFIARLRSTATPPTWSVVEINIPESLDPEGDCRRAVRSEMPGFVVENLTEVNAD